MIRDVIVIGGGAAGLMACVSASEHYSDIVLLEKNEKLGKKIYITGKGRCNVTNNAPFEVVFKNINRNSKFMYSALNDFNNTDVFSFFNNNGCPLKIERGERVFPVSDHASDVIRALSDYIKKKKVEVRLNTEVKSLIISDDCCTGVILKNGETVYGKKIIVCTGGLSYPSTGSTGDGYSFAKSAGISVTELSPSLVPIEVREDYIKDLQGLSLKNVRLTLFKGKKKLFSEIGEMLFAHFGITGPLSLSASAFIDTSSLEDLKIEIDLKPGLDDETLDKRLLKDFEENINKSFKNSLDKLLPKSLIPVIVELSGIYPEKHVNEITREERLKLLGILKHFSLSPTGLRPFAEAIITKGGVSVKEINPSTMESKKVKNLYFAGEVLDVDAMTGGFNLQIAWSTGHLAGKKQER